MGNCGNIISSVFFNFVCLIAPFFYILLFPFSWIYTFFSLYNPTCCRSENNEVRHNEKVQRVQEQVQRWNQGGRKKKMCSARGRKNTSVPQLDKSKFTEIEIGKLEDIVEIDLENMKVKVEPGMQIGTLTHKLVPRGFTIPVIPEMEVLTVGGLINGAGVETSSHKYGLFATTCLEYEIVLADGTVVNCSADQNSDLFYGIPFAYGTLGFMTSVTFPLIKAGKYVKLEYHAAKSLQQAETLMRQTGHEFIEGIAYSKENSIIMFGDFTDTPERGKINHINRWYKNWFYRHAESFLDKKEPVVEYIPTWDYYHRHTRALFWALTWTWISKTRLYIFLFGWLLPINYSFLKLIAPLPKWVIDFFLRYNIGQDFVVPMDKFQECVTLSDNMTGVYPLWYCPCKIFKRPGLVRGRGERDENYFIDVGVYGTVADNKRKHLQGNVKVAVKEFERFTVQTGGFQGMYTDCFLSPEDFGKMFDRTLYDKLRADFNCLNAFPDVYEKISVTFKRN